MSVPLLVAWSFDILQAWAAGDLEAIQRLEKPERGLASWLGIGRTRWHGDGDGRRAASAWVAAADRMVKVRDDGSRAYARFQEAEHGEVWVLIFDTSTQPPRLTGFAQIGEATFERHGEIV